MCSFLGRSVSACLRPFSRYARMNKDDDEGQGSEDDTSLWFRDLEKHSQGEFSFAVVQANAIIEDQSQVETGRHATFVGVYDGHGGTEASRYICDNLYRHLLRFAKEKRTMSEDILRNAVAETEKGFLTLVRRAHEISPQIAKVGSCCLVGVIWKRKLYVANLGDSRAIVGYLDGSNIIVAEQLTRDHNAALEEVQKELRASHPEDSQIVVMKQGAWRIKGIIQVSRSIGDAYLKRPEFAHDPSFPRFHLPEPICRPILRADPTIITRDLQPNDKFLIFASDGLWEYLSNKEAVEIVHNHSRLGIARRLLLSALEKAGKRGNTTYGELKKIDQASRRLYHDDITIIVIFIDHDIVDKETVAPELSVRGFVDTVGPSNFNFQ